MVDDYNQAEIQARKPEPIPGFPKARLVERIDVTDDLMIVKLEPELGPFTFKAGQYCTLGLDKVERAYSIVSAPHELVLEIFVELVPDGELTPRIWRMEVGDYISLRPRAKGLFTMDPKVHHHFMVATVTGIAPSVSIVRSCVMEGTQGHKIYVIEGASYQDELTYDRELSSLAASYPQLLKYIPTVSRPDEERNSAWQGAIGRVNNNFEDYLELFNLPQEDTLIYACGHPGMIEDVKTKIVPEGWMFKEERFWKE